MNLTNSQSHFQNPQSPSQFQGDFFGNDYKETDFNWDSEDEEGSGGEIVDSPDSGDDEHIDFMNIDDDEGLGWEPSVEDSNDTLEADNDDDKMEYDQLKEEEYMNAEQKTYRKPIVVRFF